VKLGLGTIGLSRGSVGKGNLKKNMWRGRMKGAKGGGGADKKVGNSSMGGWKWRKHAQTEWSDYRPKSTKKTGRGPGNWDNTFEVLV